jgi:hypothetical protein
MRAPSFAPSVTRLRLSRASIVLPILIICFVSEPARAQSCYQFSNAHGGTPATVTATFPISSIPASFVPPGQGDIDYTAAFSSHQGLDGTRASYSPTHVATIIDRGTAHTFNTFIVTIWRSGAAQRLEFSGTNYPPTDPENTLSIFIQQSAGASSRPFPDGFTATPPPFSIWGDRPSSSIDLGHVKLASISFVGPCTPAP